MKIVPALGNKALKMKLIVFLLLSIAYINCYSQTTNNIKEVKTLNIYGNGKIIIGKIIINSGETYKLYLAGVGQSKDSLQLYHNDYYFTNGNNTNIWRLDLTVKVQDTILDFHQNAPGILLCGINEDRKTFHVSCNDFMESVYHLTLISKTPLIPTFRGVDGKLF